MCTEPQIKIEIDDVGRYYAAGIGLGCYYMAGVGMREADGVAGITDDYKIIPDAHVTPATTLEYTPTQFNSISSTHVTRIKPFVIIDGVVYINAALIKENTL